MKRVPLIIDRTNPHLREESLDRVMDINVSELIGVIETPDRNYNRSIGAKENQLFHIKEGGEKTLAIVMEYCDVFKDNLLFETHNTITWLSKSGKNISKLNIKEYDIFTRRKELEKRRKTIMNQIIVRAMKSEHNFFLPLVEVIFYKTSTELSTWQVTGNSSKFHQKLNEAQDVVDDDIVDIFENTDYSSIDSFSKVLNLLTLHDELIVDENGIEQNIKLIDYLKHFIKNQI